jgi:2-haloacid dehalogenase
MIKAFVFDAYGTLFDVHSAVRTHLAQIGPSAGQLSEIWRNKQLEYSWVLTLNGAYEDFETLTAQALDFAIAKCAVNDNDLRAKLLSAYDKLQAYDEVRSVLTDIKNSGFKLAILSNGTQKMLDCAIENAGLKDLFDAVFSVDQVKCFKPRREVYALATDSLGLSANEISFQSSNRWDIAGAAQFGFRTVWINRTGQPDEYPTFKPGRIINNLDELLPNA